MAKKQVWLGFPVLCLLLGSGWALDSWKPEALSGLLRTSVHQGVLALLFLGVSRWRGGAWRKSWFSVAAWGAALLAVPQVVVAGAGGRVPILGEVLVFGLVPAVVVITVAQKASSFGVIDSPLRSLGAALAGLGGLALLVPFALPQSGLGMALLSALVCAGALAGVSAVRLHGILGEFGLLEVSAVACGAAAIVAGAFSWVGWSGVADRSAEAILFEAARCLLVDGPVLLLTLWLLREMTPVTFSARYLLVPLVTLVEGFVLVRPPWNWTMGAGFLLLAGGCVELLRTDSEEVLPQQ